jgi:hypothetical protein
LRPIQRLRWWSASSVPRPDNIQHFPGKQGDVHDDTPRGPAVRAEFRPARKPFLPASGEETHRTALTTLRSQCPGSALG